MLFRFYNTEDLSVFVKFLSEILKHPENFVETESKAKTVDSKDVDGLGLA